MSATTDAYATRTPERILPSLIDSSMLAAFRACPQQFFNQYILGLRSSARSIDLHAGGCFAEALEVFYREYFGAGASFLDALRVSRVAFEFAWGDESAMPVPEDSGKSKANVWDAVEKYLHRYPPQNDEIQPYRDADGNASFEFSFAIPLDEEHTSLPFPPHPVTGAPFVYGGRFDAFGRYFSRIVIRDEKTSSQLGNTWLSKWALRGQFIGYVWAAQTLGYDTDTVAIRGVGLLKTQRTFIDKMQSFSTGLVDRWLRQLFRDLHRIVNCWNEGYFDYNFSDSCVAFRGCTYKDLCLSDEPSNLYPSYVISRWNPLAKEHKALETSEKAPD